MFVKGLGITSKYVGFGCNKTFDEVDTNLDGDMTLSEFIKIAGPLFVPSLSNPDKLSQIDCSQCLDLDVN